MHDFFVIKYFYIVILPPLWLTSMIWTPPGRSIPLYYCSQCSCCPCFHFWDFVLVLKFLWWEFILNSAFFVFSHYSIVSSPPFLSVCHRTNEEQTAVTAVLLFIAAERGCIMHVARSYNIKWHTVPRTPVVTHTYTNRLRRHLEC